MTPEQQTGKHTPGKWIVREIREAGSGTLQGHWIGVEGDDYAICLTANPKNAAANAALIASAPQLLAFKEYVHKRLDDAGIEKNPDGEHSKHGCRIGDRLDIVLTDLATEKTLRQTMANDAEFWIEKHNRLESTNQRLREALERIKNDTFSHQVCIQIATAALKPQE